MFAAALALLTLLPAALAQLTVATPASVVVCQPAALSWSGGTAPYFPSIIPGGQPGAPALESFPTQTGNSYVWNVNIAAGTSITIQVRDSTGTTQYSSPITIQTGTDSSCVGQTSSVPAGSATSAGTSSSSTAGAGSSSSPAAAGPSSSSSSPASSSSPTSHSSSGSGTTTSHAATTSPSGTNSGASSLQVGAFSVSLVGLVAALVF